MPVANEAKRKIESPLWPSDLEGQVVYLLRGKVDPVTLRSFLRGQSLQGELHSADHKKKSAIQQALEACGTRGRAVLRALAAHGNKLPEDQAQ